MKPNAAITFSGRVARVASSRRGLVTERFDLLPNTSIAKDSMEQDEVLVEQFDFVDEPKLGPALVYARKFGIQSDTRLADIFFGNLSAVEEPHLVTGQTVASMNEADFWAVIEGSKVVEDFDQRLDTIWQKLQEIGHSEVQAFQIKLVELVEAYKLRLPVTDEFGYSEHLSEVAACTAILSGRKQFFDPSLAAGVEGNDSAVGLLSLVDNLVGEPKIEVEQRGAFRGVPPVDNSIRMEKQVREWHAMYTQELIEMLWGEADMVWDEAAAQLWQWTGTRIIARETSTGDASELIFLTGSQWWETDSDVFPKIEARLVGEAMEVVGDLVEHFGTHWARVTLPLPRLFEITRRSKMPLEQYLSTYF